MISPTFYGDFMTHHQHFTAKKHRPRWFLAKHKGCSRWVTVKPLHKGHSRWVTVKPIHKGHSRWVTVKPIHKGHSRWVTVKHIHKGHSRWVTVKPMHKGHSRWVTVKPIHKGQSNLYIKDAQENLKMCTFWAVAFYILYRLRLYALFINENN